MSRFDGLYIFEMANNHQGDVRHGVRIVREMAKVARQHQVKAAVKLQYRDLDTFIHPDYTDRTDVKHIPRFQSTRLTSDEFQMLLNEVRSEDMQTIVTPFDEASVDRCIEHGVDVLKVASCSGADWPLLEKIASTGKPVIASTGGLTLQEIDALVSFLVNRSVEFALMHCVGVYPMPPEQAQMNFLERLSRRFPQVSVGWSGHESPDDNNTVQVAVAKGARLLERHVGVETETVSLNKYSMNPEEVDAWISAARQAHAICGDTSRKIVSQAELDSMRSLKRGVYAKRDITKGTEISRDDVFFAMPCAEEQLTSGEFGRYRATFTASRDYSQNEAISETTAADRVSAIRSIIHDAKGMLFEAGIHLGSEFRVELSHHSGVDQFRRTGAVIISIVNRDYCKKLIIVFPGQNHPSHSHRRKEETFQLLYGDLEVTRDGEKFVLAPGDHMLVRQGEVHSFFSKTGAIFEEISTTHLPNDSFYEDEKIAAMDPMERKTLLEQW